jgi:hypothetical protein
LVCAFVKPAVRFAAIAMLLAAAAYPAHAQQRGAGGERGGGQRGDGGSRRGPVYQRHAFDGWHDNRGHGRNGRGPNYFAQFPPQQFNAGWFQRPYPYHLDYYRMRYGGSYAPYFGNLYGPPQVVTAPPYYGPYYGGYIGPVDEYGYGYPPPIMQPPADGEVEKVAE